ncbi:MAG TPA: DUF2163 domain-containing protein [Rhabdaerophilum sp.]|nr:DUF2163 domain-containing protein [Rhabdaerophilum sp.]
MRTLPEALAASLATGVTTHCRCWLLTRRDGLRIGVTDHDADIAIEATVFEANGGFEASDTETRNALAAGGGEIAGLMTTEKITEIDIAGGLYDAAEVRCYLVDWTAPALDFLLDIAVIGEIRRQDERFVAEIRNGLDALDEVQGRLYTATCGAELGDLRCGFALETEPFRISGGVGSVIGREAIVSADAAVGAGFYTRGRLVFTSGVATGHGVTIKDHRSGGELVFWQSLAVDVAPGDRFTLTAGCDKRFSTCRSVFGNATNFRGFPFIPAPDFVLTYARPGEGRHRGRPLVR